MAADSERGSGVAGGSGAPENGRAARVTRIGFGLFWVYVVLYFGFIALVLFRPEWLAARPLGGVNLAIASGLGLIVAALALAVVYMVAARLVESPGRDRR